MKVIYIIRIYSNEDHELLARTTGTRNDYGCPYTLLNQLGRRYGNCTIEYWDTTNGVIYEKTFD